MEDSTKLMAGILAGLAIGGAVVLLLAPEKGSKTREQLIGTLSGLGEKIKKTVTAQINGLNDKVASIKGQVLHS